MAQDKLFWGMQVSSGMNYVQKVNQSFVIRQAVLEPDNYVPGAKDRVKLFAKYENVEFLLCILSSSLENTPCQVPLEVKFEKGANLALRIEGSHHATVHLTGYSITETSSLGCISGTKRCHSCSLSLPVEKKRKLDADVDNTDQLSDDGVSTILPKTSALQISPDFQRPVADRLNIARYHSNVQPPVASNVEWHQRPIPASTSQRLAKKTRASTRGSLKLSEIFPTPASLVPEAEPAAASVKGHDVSVISITPTPTGRKSRARTGKSQPSKPAASPGRMPAVTGKGGIRIQDLMEGEGSVARMGDIVSIHCTGRVGKDVIPFYQETSQRGLTFKLGAENTILQAIHIGVEGMRVGGQRKLNIPADLAKTVPGPPLNIPSNAKGIVMFDVELMNVS